MMSITLQIVPYFITHVLFFQIQPKEECVRALTKMSNCPACQGLPDVQPCRGYCINVMKGCLAFHSELSDSWNEFVGKNQF